MGASTTDADADAGGTDRSSDGDVLLETRGLTKRFGSFAAVDGVDLAVPEGELHSIIGPNGAGKTTLFNMITGALPVSDGEIYFRGEEITDVDEDARARDGILRAFQITQLFPDLSAHENLRLAAQSRDQDLNPLSEPHPRFDEQAAEMFEEIDINADPSTTASALSHGDKKKLEIAMAIVTEPELLMLDEPTSGVSGSESEWIFEFIDEIASDLTVLLIEHDIDLVLDVSDRITVLHRGRVIARGAPGEITEDENVQEAYLGGY